MAKVRQILRHVDVETAKRKRKCSRKPNEHVILAGQRCLVVTEKAGRKSNYCQECAREILDLAGAYLAELICDLHGD